MMYEQFTEEQAKAFGKSEKWKKMDKNAIAEFQIFQDLLCIPFSIFHEAVEHRLGRPVWTHEFANRQSLIDEMFTGKPKPSFEEILNLLPKDACVIGINLDKGHGLS